MDERNCIRVKEFRQLRKEIRGSDGCLIVGIDVAKRKHNAFFGTSTGKTLLKGEASASPGLPLIKLKAK